MRNRMFTGGDVHYTDEQLEFLRAVDRYKQVNLKPTWAEILRLAISLGYRKVAEPTRVQQSTVLTDPVRSERQAEVNKGCKPFVPFKRRRRY